MYGNYPRDFPFEQRKFVIIYPRTAGQDSLTLSQLLSITPSVVYNLETALETNFTDGKQIQRTQKPGPNGSIDYEGLDPKTQHYIFTSNIADALDLLRSRYRGLTLLSPEQY